MAQRPTIRRKANWRFGKSRRPARPVCAKRSNETVSQALDSALRAGRVSGDTGLFQDWLCVKGLQGRGAPLVRRLKAEYERGVVGGDPSPSRPASAKPLTIAPEGTYNMPPQSPRSPQSGATTHAQITRYKGIAIEPAGDGWTTNLDRQSHFDTQEEAKRFIDAWAKGGARNPRSGGEGVLNFKTQANPMHYFDTRKDAQATARLLKRAGYPVLGIETHKATGYGIYRTKAGASLDSDAPGGALEVAFALLGQGKYAYRPATEADMEWFSRQWPEEYTRIVKAFGKDTPSKRNGAKSIMDSPSFSDDERARRLEERAQRLEGKRGDAEQTERKYVLAILKFYHYNGRFPDFSDYELGPVGRNPNRGCEEFSDQGAGYGYSEDGEDGGLDEGPVDPYPGADVLVVANPGLRNPGLTKLNAFLAEYGGVVYYIYEDSERIQGVPLKQQGAWGESTVHYSEDLEWKRAYKSTIHGTTVITVPWAGGHKEFVVYGNDVLKTLVEKPRKEAKPAKAKGLSVYRGYNYQRLQTPWGMKYFAAKPPAQPVSGEEDFTAKTKEDLFRQIDEYGDHTANNPYRTRRSNPGPEADRLYESFHGCPPEETVLVETEVHEHDHLTQLGDLTELKIKTLTGLEATIDFEKQGVMLCSSEDGKQLYFEGGNQELDLGQLDMDGDEWVRDLMVIGELTETTYRTQKAFDKFKTIDYYHENGEDSGVAPDLLYDPISRLMRVAGGQYEVKPEGIVN